MRVILEIRGGPLAGRKVPVEPGARLTVGRTGKADFAVASDPLLSSAHFAVEHGERLVVKDLGSANGTFVNGERITEARLQEGDRLRAGDTTFRITFERAPAAVPAPPRAAELAPPAARLVDLLRGSGSPLYAILDAARDRRILKLLNATSEERATLYDGLDGELLADWAPWLVRLPPASPLLEALAAEGWGKSWGVYLRSARPFKEVRRHLRRFLLVEEDGSPDKVYFRFYDPRVLRVFLSCATARQTGLFFEDIDAYLLEDDPPASLLSFTRGEEGPVRAAAALTVPRG